MIGLVYVSGFAPDEGERLIDVIRSLAQRAGAKITELKGSHVILISKPKQVADVIIVAAQTAGRHS